MLPAYDQIVVADDGKVWARVYWPELLAPATWDVFAPSREWLGPVRTPEGFTGSAVAGGKLVGVWRDELLVEYVRVYRLRAEEWRGTDGVRWQSGGSSGDDRSGFRPYRAASRRIGVVFHEIVSDVVHIDLLHVPPRRERPFHTLVTCGMSVRPMNVPQDAEEFRYERTGDQA